MSSPLSSSAAHDLAVRVEKLRFLVDELQFADALACSAPDSAEARMLSRHVLVRSENFIEHVRALRRPLNVAGFNTTEFHRTKEIYATTFEEYFAEARHRLGAHVQDLDFAHRIEIWREIEREKIAYFVSGAREIHDLLSNQNVPGFQASAPPAEFATAELGEALARFAAGGGAKRAEMATDSLALTRPNAIAMLNLTPIHARASQITMLARWIRAQAAALDYFDCFPALARILKARLITDVVSLHDCLITRAVPPGAPQEMKGLDALLREDGRSVETIDRFLQVSLDGIGPARDIRNRIGAHLEDDVVIPLADLIRDLDDAPLAQILARHEALLGLFHKLCRSVPYLMPYLADGVEIAGVALAHPAASVPYDKARPDPMPVPPEHLTFGEDEYAQALAGWLSDDLAARRDALHYFRNAFAAAPVEQVVPLEERNGLSTRYHQVELRTVHTFLLRALREASDDRTLDALAALAANGASGYPTQLAEILVRYLEAVSPVAPASVVAALGEVAPWWHERAREVLEAQFASADHEVAIWSRISLFKMFVHDEGLVRVNQRRNRPGFAKLQGQLLAGFSSHGELLLAISLLSQFAGTRFHVFSKVFAFERAALVAEAERLLVGLAGKLEEARLGPLRKLIDHQMFATAALLLSEWLEDAEGNLADDFRRWVCGGAIVTVPVDDDRRHQAICCLRVGSFSQAVDIADELARRNPDDVDLQLLHVEALAAAEQGHEGARARLAGIRTLYTIGPDLQPRLAELDTRLGNLRSGVGDAIW